MSSTTLTEPTTVSAPADRPVVDVAAIRSRALLDASASGPVSLLFAFAVVWLVAWSVLNLILSWKLLYPEFLSSSSFLTYGRLRPIATNMFAYGWASCAGMGVSLWLMVRLCRVKLGSPLAVVIGTLIWNAGLLGGLIALHFGASRSLEYLEMPLWSQMTMLGGFMIIGLWTVGLFFNRHDKSDFITQYYLVAAFVWFAWTFLAGNIFASLPWVHGVIIAINSGWFVAGLSHYWFTAIGLGAAFYLIPKVSGRPIHSYYLAKLGFWAFAFLAGWGGIQSYNGGPIPTWLVTMNIVATALTIIPVATVAVNHHLTVHGEHQMMHYSPTLRFTIAGAMAYTVSSLTAILLSLRTVAQQTGLTYTTAAQNHFVLYAFFSFIMFGAIYFIVPRLVGREWVSATLIKGHFWAVAYGIGMTIAFLAIAGLFQGKEWANANIPNNFVNQVVVEATVRPLWGTVLGGVLLLIGHVIFAFHFLLMLLRLGHVNAEPTLIAALHPEEAH